MLDRLLATDAQKALWSIAAVLLMIGIVSIVRNPKDWWP